jgi:hypothetical protein
LIVIFDIDATKITKKCFGCIDPKCLALKGARDEGNDSLEIEGFTLPLFDALNQYKQNAYIPLSDGTHAIVNQNYMNRLMRLFKKRKDKVKVSFFDLPLVEELIDEKIAESAFKKSREIFLGLNKLTKSGCDMPVLQAPLSGQIVCIKVSVR